MVDQTGKLIEMREALAAGETADLLTTQLERLPELQRRVGAELTTAGHRPLLRLLIAAHPDALGMSSHAHPRALPRGCQERLTIVL